MQKLIWITLPLLLLFSCVNDVSLPEIANRELRDTLRISDNAADSVALVKDTVAPSSSFVAILMTSAFPNLTSANQFRVKVGEVMHYPYNIYINKNSKTTYYSLTSTMSMSPGTYGVQVVFNDKGKDYYVSSKKAITVQPIIKNVYLNVVNLMALRPNALSTAESGNFAFRIKEFNNSSFVATSSAQTRSYSTTGGWTPSAYTWNLPSEIKMDKNNRYFIQLLKNGVFVREMEIPFTSLSEGSTYLEIQSSSDFNIAYDFKVGLTFNWK